jgi:hypothetical protein
MANIVRIEASVYVTQIYNSRPIMARYEVTKRCKGNYQVDFYADGDYAFQWNNENCSDGDFTYKRFTKALAIEMMMQLASNLIIHTHTYIWL